MVYKDLCYIDIYEYNYEGINMDKMTKNESFEGESIFCL